MDSSDKSKIIKIVCVMYNYKDLDVISMKLKLLKLKY